MDTFRLSNEKLEIWIFWIAFRQFFKIEALDIQQYQKLHDYDFAFIMKKKMF